MRASTKIHYAKDTVGLNQATKGIFNLRSFLSLTEQWQQLLESLPFVHPEYK